LLTLQQTNFVFYDLDGRYIFEPIAIETGSFSTLALARQLLSDLGRKISQSSEKVGEASFSVPEMLSAGVAILLHDS